MFSSVMEQILTIYLISFLNGFVQLHFCICPLSYLGIMRREKKIENRSVNSLETSRRALGFGRALVA
jgi:hypothetical protein